MSSIPTDVCAELELKVRKAADVIASIPGFTPEENGVEPCEKYVWNRLASMQLGRDDVSHEMLMSEYTKEGDMRTVFCENGKPNLAVPWFRKVYAILKGKNGAEADLKKVMSEVTGGGILGGQVDVAEELKELIASNRPVSQWKDGEVVSALSPDCSYEIIDELKKINDNLRSPR